MKYNKGACMLSFDMDPYFSKDDFIYFWKHDDLPIEKTYACFSQWYPSRFMADGVEYCCAEQYMMAEKASYFGDDAVREMILQETDPKSIKELGRRVKNFNPEKWAIKSEGVVFKGNLYKFSQNIPLLGILLTTDKKTLVEASPYDKIWGIGMTAETAKKYGYPHVWKGENKLGFILMEVRDILSNAIREAAEIQIDKTLP